MYNEHFNLTEPPFRLSPDPQFLYASRQHARAKAYMDSIMWLTDGFVVITGEIGSGKTTLIQSFIAGLDEDVELAHVSQTQISPTQFLQAILVEFGYRPFQMKKAELLDTLNTHLIEQYAAGRKVLLIVDEAQNLDARVLEELRMLSGVETQKEKVLRIILAGQPELSRQLDQPHLEQLTQRVRLRFHLGPLTRDETRQYVEHRLRVAGAGDRQIFTDETFPQIFRYSGGTPRLTNTLCDTAMLCAFADGKQQVDEDDVQAAVDELQWPEFRARQRGMPAQSPTQSAGDTGSFATGRMRLFHGDREVAAYELHSGRLIIGRTSDNDLQIRSQFVSRHHAQVLVQGGTCVIEDLNSTNGILLDGDRIKQRRLRHGDRLQLGEHYLLYEDLADLDLDGDGDGDDEYMDDDDGADDADALRAAADGDR